MRACEHEAHWARSPSVSLSARFVIYAMGEGLLDNAKIGKARSITKKTVSRGCIGKKKLIVNSGASVKKIACTARGKVGGSGLKVN